MLIAEYMWVVCAHVIMKFFVSLFVFFPFLKQPRSKVWKMEVSVLLIYSQLTFMTFILHDQKRRSPPGVGKGYRPSPLRLVKIMVNIDCGQNELLRMHLMAIIEDLVFNFFFLVTAILEYLCKIHTFPLQKPVPRFVMNMTASSWQDKLSFFRQSLKYLDVNLWHR